MTQEALKLALDALETELSIDWTNNDEFNASAEKMYEAIAAIKEALAQPEQEPVACVGPWHDARLTLIPRYSHQTFEREQPLYAAPPRRTWVGLTDTEIDAIYTGVRAVHREIDSDVFARAIEAKLKEKNT
jgi:hypothetical protein